MYATTAPLCIAKQITGAFRMMQHTHIAIIVALMFFLAPTVHGQGMADGYRGQKWGSKPLKGMKAEGTYAGMKRYTASDDDPVVLGKQARSILYSYFKGGLCKVDVGWPLVPLSDVENLLANAKHFWGDVEATKSERYIDALWKSATGITLGSVVAYNLGDKWEVHLSMKQIKCAQEASGASGL